MRIFILLFIILAACAPSKVVDSFRPKELQNLTKCERLMKRAVTHCPSLVDTTKKEGVFTLEQTDDSTTVSKTVDSIVSYCDTLKWTDTLYLPAQRDSVKKVVKKKLSQLVKDYPCKFDLPKDSIVFKTEGLQIKAWNESGKLKFHPTYTLKYYKEPVPCPEHGRNWGEYILMFLVGLSAGVIVMLCIKLL